MHASRDHASFQHRKSHPLFFPLCNLPCKIVILPFFPTESNAFLQASSPSTLSLPGVLLTSSKRIWQEIICTKLCLTYSLVFSLSLILIFYILSSSFLEMLQNVNPFFPFRGEQGTLWINYPYTDLTQEKGKREYGEFPCFPKTRITIDSHSWKLKISSKISLTDSMCLKNALFKTGGQYSTHPDPSKITGVEWGVSESTNG